MVRRLVKLLGVIAILALSLPVLIVLVFAFQARAVHGDLKPWHQLHLTSEFRADRSDAPRTFAEYRQLEERLFAEVRRMMADPKSADGYALSRYTSESVPAQLALETPYNHSYEMVPDTVRGGALLVHGLSDSPYSMRALAEILRDQGYYVLVLRMPGHGTIPSGLLDVTWKDWYRAVEIAAVEAARRAGPGRPFIVGGHSTGGALTTLYSLRTLADASLPRPTRLVLISPAIGITKLAVLTKVLSGLAFIPYFEKSRWIDVLPEYDPYKYNSFPVNAASQIYSLTREVQRVVEEEKALGRLDSMPRVLAFQSLIDATVTTSDVVHGLMQQLPPQGHELVVFDVNRSETLKDLIAPSLVEDLEKVRKAPPLPFRLTWIANRNTESREVIAYTREAESQEVAQSDLGLSWPAGVLSLGHVALPFPEDDPVYGLVPAAGTGPRYPLGALTVRGESGALVVSLEQLARLRSNPFFSVIRDRVTEAARAELKD